ncbi:hypothetical protein H2199_003830 [Coniosporium tulheliwenetii]|uniref:Uncharacterized protein n=1 Tax=Coniosporium tulheliwenetii TaxID=3383036 RepID=A0ACC2Z8V7_9PEZI|nr:hypothetical protein H2199_003830 [Cladosporium sp. JES 115]
MAAQRMTEKKQKEIISALFGKKEDDIALQDYRDYFELYHEELRVEASYHDTPKVRDIVTAVVIGLSGNGEVKRRLVRRFLTDTFPDEDEDDIERYIDLALRVWLMEMGDEETLSMFVRSFFRRCETPPTAWTVPVLAHPLTVASLERFSGITIQWTSYLAEHLKFNHGARTLKVFANKRWLLDVTDWMRRTSQDDPAPIPIPLHILEETIKTLDALFPWNDETSDFLDKHSKDFHLLTPPSDTPIDLQEFTFYRDRLLEIITEFQTPPRDWRTIWKDRRNPMQFWTFWLGLLIVILTLIFGFLSALIAGLQLRIAQHPPPPGP